MPEKIIRDPVHDLIAFRMEDPGEALLFRLVNAAEFQRLRRIRQLGMASLAYPGADHSRYSHSLGVMQVARMMLDRLQRVGAVLEPSRTACLCAALLHDLGHGPFSHVFERVSGIRHEHLTNRVILDPESEVHQILIRHDPVLPEAVVELLSGQAPRTALHDVLSSQLDADRFDYLLRDSLMTGVRYGGFDLRWLLQSVTVESGSGRLAVDWKGVSAVEQYLLSRHNMYRNVYFHKVVRAAEGMVQLALRRARKLAMQGRLVWPGQEMGVYKALVGERMTTREFTELDDVAVLSCFKMWSAAEDQALARLCNGLLRRRVFKTLDLSEMPEFEARATFERAVERVRSAGGDAEHDLFYDEPANTPYHAYSPDSADASSEIMVVHPDGSTRGFSSISPMIVGLSKQLMFRRIHVAEPYRSVIPR
jgi:HD superfamily phosphohydrolase